MLITRYGNDNVMVEVIKRKQGYSNNVINKYFIAIGEADDLSTIPEIPYDDIDKIISILEHVKKAIQQDINFNELMKKAEEAETSCQE